MSDEPHLTDAIRGILDVNRQILDAMRKIERNAHGTNVGLLHLLKHLVAQNVIAPDDCEKIISEMKKAEADGDH